MFTRPFAVAAIIAFVLPGSGWAQVSPEKVDTLVEAMGLPAMLEVMQAEGLDYGLQIAEDLFPNRPADDWPETVEAIYVVEAMDTVMRTTMAATLQEDTIDEITAFFSDDLGQRIVGLELGARQAMMDEDIETASKEAAAIALTDETPRAQLAEDFVTTNDLIEANVVGAMNANYAFYLGMLDGGGLTGGLTEDEILSTVWSQEPDIRQNTTEWVYSYVLLAYQPLSEEEFDAYIAFSKTEAGQDLNTALFAAFDDMYDGISRALGRAASQHMIGEDL